MRLGLAILLVSSYIGTTTTDAFALRPPSLLTRTSTTRTSLSMVSTAVTNGEGGATSSSFNRMPSSSSGKETTVAAVPKVAQRWRKSTKQVVTLGPASSSKEMIEKLFLAGADVFRLNFSHGSQEQKKELLIMIREIEEKYSHPIAILGDLQGPKLRVRILRSLSMTEVFVSFLTTTSTTIDLLHALTSTFPLFFLSLPLSLL